MKNFNFNIISFKVYILVCFLLFTFSFSFSQRRGPGYIVKNNGTKVGGILKKRTIGVSPCQVVIFYDESGKKKYYPGDIRSYSAPFGEYETKTITYGKKRFKQFLKVLEKGFCTLHELQQPQATNTPHGTTYSNIILYFVKKGNGKLHKINFSRLKKGKDTYFSDDKTLQQDIVAGKYSIKDLAEIVKRYNQGR